MTSGALTTALNWARHGVKAATRHRPPFILCYHGVGDPAGPDRVGLFISSKQFAEHLDVIANRSYTLVTISELWRLIAAGDGDGYAAISFDDAFDKTVDEALPLLRARGMPSTMYVPTGLLGAAHPHLRSERVIGADRLTELAADGVEIGSHTVDHDRLPELSYDRTLEQLRRSREDLEQMLSREVTTVAYPFGAFSPETMQAARAAGYQTACACAGSGPWEQLALPREPIFPSITRLRLRLKMAGLYGPVHRAVGARSQV